MSNERIYSIYRATNTITNKVYIGFASNWHKRINSHKCSYKKTSNKFYNAIRKYGWDNFYWECIYQQKETTDPRNSYTLNVMEPHFIKEYDSILLGYNTCRGGDCGPIMYGKDNRMYKNTHTPEARTKISVALTGLHKGKTYAQIYGSDNAERLKKQRSDSIKDFLKETPRIKEKNANYDKTVYTFYNVNTGVIITTTQYDLRSMFDLKKPCTTSMVRNGTTYRGWCVLYSC